jgi:hypothetical protein
VRFYLVTGRMIGDDEDTVLTPVANSRAEAIGLFIEEMWAMELGSCLDTYTFDREQAEAVGEGVVVNGVYESDSPITKAR